MYKCLECGEEFDERTAHCEDWRNPLKKLGCPSCKTFFEIDQSGGKQWIYIIYWVLSFMAIGGCIDSALEGHVRESLKFGVISILLFVYFYKFVPLSKLNQIKRVQA